MKSARNCRMIAVLQLLYLGDAKFISTGQIFPPDTDQFKIMIFTVFWDNVLLSSCKIFGNHKQWKLCTLPTEVMEIKCVELIILNLKLNKRNEMFNNKVESLQLFIFNILPNLVHCINI